MLGYASTHVYRLDTPRGQSCRDMGQGVTSAWRNTIAKAPLIDEYNPLSRKSSVPTATSTLQTPRDTSQGVDRTADFYYGEPYSMTVENPFGCHRILKSIRHFFYDNPSDKTSLTPPGYRSILAQSHSTCYNSPDPPTPWLHPIMRKQALVGCPGAPHTMCALQKAPMLPCPL